MKISVVLVNHNEFERTRNAVASVQQCSPESEIIVVDNGSTDGSVESLRREFPGVRLVPLPENRGFGAGNNKGAAVALGEFLFFLNADTLLLEDTPNLLVRLLESNPTVAACGPKVANEDHTFQISFGLDPSLLNEWKVRRIRRRLDRRDPSVQRRLESRFSTEREVDWITGAALMIRRDVFKKVGGFDERFFMYFEDADLCRRVRNLGFKILYAPGTQVIHFGGNKELSPASKITLEYRRSQLHYYRKHVGVIGYSLLRFYLLCKFSFRWLASLVGARGSRLVAAGVVRMSLRGLGRNQG
jgi:N-acetylglucosaminyl-diphospho-decaprenol L-rhamnosyltransferase